MGIGRITKAEFIKTFKKPTVYIMAFILLCILIVTAYIFKPTYRTDDRLSYASASTGIEAYNQFNSTGVNTKSSINESFSSTDNKITYFNNINTRNEAIEAAYDNLQQSISKLKKDKSNDAKNAYISNLTKFKQSLEDKYGLDSFDFVNKSYSLKFYTELIFELEDFITQAESATIDSIINTYNNTDSSGQTRYDRLLFIKNTSQNFVLETINFFLSNVDYAFYGTSTVTGYYQLYFRDQLTNNPEGIAKQDELLTFIQINLTELHDFIGNKLLGTDYTLAYINNDDFETFVTSYEDIVNKLINNTVGKVENWSARYEKLKAIAEHDFIKVIPATLDNIQPISLSKSTLNQLSDYQKSVTKHKATILANIEKTKTQDSPNAVMSDITDYYLLSENYSNLVDDTILLQSTKGMSTKQIVNLYGDNFEFYNKYEISERLALNEYKVTKNISGQHNLNALGFGTTSGYDKNAYDYMFYALSIVTVVITIFAIMMTATTIASEQDSGTIKLLLVRPYTRTKILLSKLLSVFFFIVTFCVFAFIISFVAGWAIFGLTNAQVLAIFNGSSVFSIHPLLLMLIHLLTMIFQITFYASIAFTLAVVFKNFATALVSSVVVYLGAITCNLLLTKSVAYKILPFTNTYLFRYFGGAFASSTNTLSNIFVQPIYTSMNFVWSLVISLLFMTIMYLISFLVFKQRDF